LSLKTNTNKIDSSPKNVKKIVEYASGSFEVTPGIYHERDRDIVLIK